MNETQKIKIDQENPLVSIVVVNFNGAHFIPKMLHALKNQTYQNWELMYVDNGSKDDSLGKLDSLSKKLRLQKKIEVLALKKNLGFAEANNVGVKQSRGDFILFLNTDAFPEPRAVQEMVACLKGDLFLAGVAPKVFLSRFYPVKLFDSIGICVDHNASPYNRGIGMIDVGQYDKPEEVFGLCFACCLVRKNVFELTGGLDPDYFAYFEDVDWSIRARKMGYHFRSCPWAEVYHVHSATSSKKSYAWKYHLIFRNFLRTILKNFGKKSTLRLLKQIIGSLVKMFFKRDTDPHYRMAIVRLLFNFVTRDIFLYSWKRFWVRKKFIHDVTDEQLWAFSQFEPSQFFDPVTYEPVVSEELIRFLAYKKNFYQEIPGLEKKLQDLQRYFRYAPTQKEFETKFRSFAKGVFGNKLTPQAERYLLDCLVRPVNAADNSPKQRNRRMIAHRYFPAQGNGIEIGATFLPVRLLPGCQTTYVDVMYTHELIRLYPDLKGKNVVKVDVVDDAEKLGKFRNESQDYIIANHFLEHTIDPIKTLKNFLRVLRPGGVIFMAIPDKRVTFDKDRYLTPVEHLIEVYEKGEDPMFWQHYIECAKYIEKQPEHKVEARAQELLDTKYSIHYHTFTVENFAPIIKYMRQKNLPIELLELQDLQHGTDEFIAVMKKTKSKK